MKYAGPLNFRKYSAAFHEVIKEQAAEWFGKLNRKYQNKYKGTPRKFGFNQQAKLKRKNTQPLEKNTAAWVCCLYKPIRAMSSKTLIML